MCGRPHKSLPAPKNPQHVFPCTDRAVYMPVPVRLPGTFSHMPTGVNFLDYPDIRNALDVRIDVRFSMKPAVCPSLECDLQRETVRETTRRGQSPSFLDHS